MTKTKRCPGCHQDFPLDEQHFHRDKTQSSGLKSRCKRCQNKSVANARAKRAPAPVVEVPPRLMSYSTMPAWPSVAAFDAEIESPDPKPEPRIEVVEETITRVEEHRLKRRIKDLEAELREMTEQLSEGGEYHEVIEEVLSRQGEYTPSIEPRERNSGLREGMPLVLASDWHIEEEVLPEQVEGRNRYNLDIARHRMERFFEATRWGINQQRDTFKIRDLMMWFGGDLITNFLHEDNVESNLLHPTEAIMMAQVEIQRGIDFMLEDPEIEQFVFPCNDGNHGRTTKKMRSATRTKNSLEVFLYAQLALHYKNEPRVRFILPTSSFNYVRDVYGRTIRFLHGDVFRYGGGIGGIFVPMFRALGRWESVQHADLTCMGHWHQRICLPNVMVNGCFVDGTRVLTPQGPRPIETIGAGDEVLSRDGSIQRVEHTMTKKADSLIRFRVKGLPNFIECTPNHEIWAIKGESGYESRPGRNGPRTQPTIINEQPQWLAAEYLSEGDWVHTPHLKGSEREDLDLLWAYGLFMAEGHTVVNGGSTGKHFRIEFTMHIDELPVLERAKRILDERFSSEGRIWTRPERTTSQLSYSGREVATAYREQFGHLASGKKVPDWMFRLAPDCRQAVVQGWFDGDGHSGKCTTASTISETLGWGMYLLAVGTEFEPLLYSDGTRRVEGKAYAKSYRVSFVTGQDVRWVNGERFLRIDFRRRELREARVHDLQVTGEHTYCVEGVGVHNSLIGFNSYAMDIGANFEPPVQSMRMLEPRRWCSTDIPLWVSERADDQLAA